MPPSTCTFERAWEHVTVSRHQATGYVRIVAKWSDGITCSCDFVSVEQALDYHQQLESALRAAGWMREESLTARPSRANSTA
jgi:hypothetical protein